MVLKAKNDGKKAGQPLIIGKEYKVIDISTPGGHPKPLMDFTNLILPKEPHLYVNEIQ